MPSARLRRLRSSSSLERDNRVSKDVRFNSRWESVMETWSQLMADSPTPAEKHFVSCQDGSIVRVTPMESSGLYSKIFTVSLNGVEQPVIIKVANENESEENVPLWLEAELQMYAAKSNFGPKVFWYSEKAILSQKCKEQPIDPRIRLNIDRSATPEERMEEQKRVSVARALQPQAQRRLKLTLDMFEELGMYNADSNIDNYMEDMSGNLVQIDFGMNRFASRAAMNKWFNSLPLPVRSRVTSRLQDMLTSPVPGRPECEAKVPPAQLFWVSNLISRNAGEKFSEFQKRKLEKQKEREQWSLQQWKDYFKQLDPLHSIELKF